MSRLDALRHRLAVLLRPRQYARDLESERQFHLELEAMQRRHVGIDADEAHFSARRQFGNVTYYSEETRRMTSLPIVDALVQDLRYTLRMLRRSPGFATIAVVTIALGIGVNTAIMSVIHSLLLARLPYANAERLVSFGVTQIQGQFMVPAPPGLLDAWRTRARTIEHVAMMRTAWDTVVFDGEQELVWGADIESGLPKFLGVRPMLGRTFLPQDATPGAPHAVVIGYDMWQRRFGGRPNVLGHTLEINSQPYTVIGVMPPDFDLFMGGLYRYELWTPLVPTPDATRLSAIARLRPGATTAQANRELSALITSLGRDDSLYASYAPDIRTLYEIRRGASMPSLLFMLAGASGFVLLIICANLANLLLARGMARQHELSIRSAIGAGRGRLVRQLLTESTLLAVIGGAAGLLVAWLTLHVLIAIRPDTLFRQLDRVHLEPVMLLWELGITLVTGLVFGLAPALMVARRGAGITLVSGARSVTGSGRSRYFRSALMIAEIALSVVLLVGAGLLVRTMRAMERFDPGFDTHRLLSMDVVLPPARYPDAPQRKAVYDALLGKVERLPGVGSAAFALVPPPAAAIAFGDLEIDGRTLGPGEHVSILNGNTIQPSYLRVLGIPLLAGQMPSTDTSAHEVLINRTMARRYWPGSSPLGQRLRLSKTQPWSTVVGIVEDISSPELEVMGRDLWIYRPFTGSLKRAELVLRTRGETPALVRQIAAAVRAIDPEIRLGDASTVDQDITRSMQGQRFMMQLLTSFALLALILAAIGLYGVIAYTVSQRTREMGIRIALGARPVSVIRLVLAQGLGVTCIGVILGLASAAAATRLIRNLLFGVGPLDPGTFAVVGVLLGVVALVAAYVPARRVSRVDPVIALRAE